jgi:MoaA/NifB/PqqE/SkfB family radical SAM enzyme
MLQLVSEAGYLLQWALKTKFLNKKRPLIGVVVTNNTCNLNCVYCPVTQFDSIVIPFAQIKKDIQTLYNNGIRMLTITGGEPLLWTDKQERIEDVISYAKQMGMYEIILCTNGTFPIKTNAEIVMISLDGTEETHDNLDGKSFQLIMKNIDESDHDKIFIQYTITKENQHILENTILELKQHPQVKGILFNIYIPFIGSPMKRYTNEEINNIVNNIIELKKKYPDFITNTLSALHHLKKDDWKRPLWISQCIYNGELSPCCCRKEIVNPEICSKCYLAACAESYIVQNLEISAVIEFLKKYY